MAETVKYIDENGNEITVERSTVESLPGFLFETFFENGKRLFEKQYEAGKLTSLSVCAYSEEEISGILERDENASIIFLYNKNNHDIREDLQYENGKLAEKFVTVKDKDGNTICFQKFELKNMVLTPVLIEKSYYENGVEKYDFEYDKNGNCYIIHSVQTYQEDIFAWDIGKPDTEFTWAGMEYYKYSEPTVPEK